ncbi:MAG: STN domain-containing protein, partial [Niabella sp.]
MQSFADAKVCGDLCKYLRNLSHTEINGTRKPYRLLKTLLIMKLTTILLLAACLQVSARGYAQITLREKQASLEKVLQAIKRQTGMSLVYEDQLLQKAKPVTVQVTNATLQQALTAVFKDQPLSWEIIAGRVISIKEKPVTPAQPQPVLPPPPRLIDVHGRVV